MLGLLGGQEIMVIFLVGFCVSLIPKILFLVMAQTAFNRCSPENRAMSPAMVWLALIPLFSLAWNFIIVSNLGKSLQAEYNKRRLPLEGDPGGGIGLAMCILAACGLIPLVNFATAPAGLACLIAYCVKIAGLSSKLA